MHLVAFITLAAASTTGSVKHRCSVCLFVCPVAHPLDTRKQLVDTTVSLAFIKETKVRRYTVPIPWAGHFQC